MNFYKNCCWNSIKITSCPPDGTWLSKLFEAHVLKALALTYLCQPVSVPYQPIPTGLIFTVALSVKRNTRCFKCNELNGVNNFWPQIWAHKHFSIAPGIIYRTTTSGKEEWKRDHGWMAGGSKTPLNSNPLFQTLLLVQSYHLNQLISLSTLCCPISAQLSKRLVSVPWFQTPNRSQCKTFSAAS